MELSVWLAAGAGVVALLAPGATLWMWRSVATLRAGQEVLLPDGSAAPLVDRQAALQRAMNRLQDGLTDIEQLVGRQAEANEAALRTSLRFQGMVRYDAYHDMGGRQSWSVALLDGTHSGSVITSLHARDHARVYLKQITEGVPSQRLSPEEVRAVTLALGRPPGPPPETAAPIAGPQVDDAPAAGAQAKDAGPAGDDAPGPDTGEDRTAP
jgi:hypothetical protein